MEQLELSFPASKYQSSSIVKEDQLNPKQYRSTTNRLVNILKSMYNMMKFY